jgi:hypothetical protein
MSQHDERPSDQHDTAFADQVVELLPERTTLQAGFGGAGGAGGSGGAGGFAAALSAAMLVAS